MFALAADKASSTDDRTRRGEAELNESEGLKLSERVRGASPAETYPDLKERREALTKLLDAHLGPARACLGFTTGELYLPDLLLAGVVQRSFHLLEGFLAAYDSWNVIVAAPLVRLQIDNLLRLNYLSLGSNLDETTMRLLEGVEFRKLRDRDGKQLSDYRLRQLAAPRYPWIDKVYEKASGWVHLRYSHSHGLQDGEQERHPGGCNPAATGIHPQVVSTRASGRDGQATRDSLLQFESWDEHKKTLAAASPG